MKLEQLHYFVETAKRQHIGQAAHFLHITPSAISHSIAALENELGRSLFTKHGRQIKLTPHGKVLLERAEFLLAEADRIRDELSVDQLKMQGHYRLAATSILCSEFLTPVWMEIQKKYPNLTAALQSSRSGEVLSCVNSGEVDLGICFCPHMGPNHEQEIIHQGKLVFSFGKEHPFLQDRKVKDLETYPSIAAQAAEGIVNCENHPAYKKLKIQPKIVTLYDSYDVAIQALKSNKVWALMPDFLAYIHRAEVESFMPTGWDFDYTIVAIWPKNRQRNQVIDYVITELGLFIKKIISTLE